MKSLLSLEELLSAVNGKQAGNAKECIFTTVQTDSRLVEKNTMFVPLIGEFQDGHKYVTGAVEKGASVVLVDEKVFEADAFELKSLPAKYPAVCFILVKNTLHGLQDAAEAYVAKFPEMIKISITGSSGKTTTKEMMVSVFKQAFGEDNVAWTKGNFNSETGLPLSVFKIKGNEKYGIFEMGMNRENEIGEISKVLKSKYGIITNIGTAHIGILGSRENIAREKRKSFDYIPCDGACFVPASDDFADFCTENVKGKIVKYGKTVDKSLSGVEFVRNNGLKGTTFTLDGVEINLPLCGEYNYQNALGVAAVAKQCGISCQDIKKGLEAMTPVSGRMDNKEIELKNNKTITLISDCYNANPDSMKKVIEFVSGLELNGKKIFVLGDMKELGEKSAAAHKSVGQACKESGAAIVYLVGPEMAEAKKICAEAVYFDNNSDDVFNTIAEDILKNASTDDLVLLKGSHSMSLEKIIPLISKEGGNC